MLIPTVRCRATITAYIDGHPYTATSTSINYLEILKLLSNEDLSTDQISHLKHLFSSVVGVVCLMTATNNKLIITYANDVDAQYRVLPIGNGVGVDELMGSPSMPSSLYYDSIQGYEHIGTFTSIDDLFQVYPEYFI